MVLLRNICKLLNWFSNKCFIKCFSWGFIVGVLIILMFFIDPVAVLRVQNRAVLTKARSGLWPIVLEFSST